MFSTCQKTQELWMWKMEYLHHEHAPGGGVQQGLHIGQGSGAVEIDREILPGFVQRIGSHGGEGRLRSDRWIDGASSGPRLCRDKLLLFRGRAGLKQPQLVHQQGIVLEQSVLVLQERFQPLLIFTLKDLRQFSQQFLQLVVIATAAFQFIGQRMTQQAIAHVTQATAHPIKPRHPALHAAPHPFRESCARANHQGDGPAWLLGRDGRLLWTIHETGDRTAKDFAITRLPPVPGSTKAPAHAQPGAQHKAQPRRGLGRWIQEAGASSNQALTASAACIGAASLPVATGMARGAGIGPSCLTVR